MNGCKDSRPYPGASAQTKELEWFGLMTIMTIYGFFPKHDTGSMICAIRIRISCQKKKKKKKGVYEIHPDVG